MVYISMQMGLLMKEIGSMINNMVLVLRFGQINLHMRVNLLMVKNKEKETQFLQMDQNMMENSRIMKYMDLVHMNGQIKEHIKDTG